MERDLERDTPPVQPRSGAEVGTDQLGRGSNNGHAGQSQRNVFDSGVRQIHAALRRRMGIRGQAITDDIGHIDRAGLPFQVQTGAEAVDESDCANIRGRSHG